jgi:hypothetical protein
MRRNREIATRVEAGETRAAVARAFGISVNRVAQIVEKEAVREAQRERSWPMRELLTVVWLYAAIVEKNRSLASPTMTLQAGAPTADP